MGKSLKPIFRFKGFTDDWGQRKLGDNVELITKGTTPKNQYSNSDVNFVKVENLKNGIITPLVQINIDEHLGPLKRSILEDQDILISIAGTLGRVAKVEYNLLPANTNQALCIIRGYKFDSNFLITFLSGRAVKEYIRKNPTIGAQPNLSLEQINNLVITAPIFDEQDKIGRLFKTIDNTIALHQHKIKLLNIYKKTMLSKMFPKNGEFMPEIRFNGYNDAWEQRKLGEIAQIVGGGTPSTTVAEYWNGDIDWYSPVEIGKNIYVSGSQKKITELGLKKSSAKILPIGTILFTSRAGIGNAAILTKEGSTNQGFQSILPIKLVLDNYFIFSRVTEIKKYAETVGAGSTFLEVSGKQLSQMDLLIPGYSEQCKIGQFFKVLDNTIAHHQLKLDKLNIYKKTMLAKIFI